ncbi:Adenosine deaminase-like protein [Gracilariopsis chorda]|uniref:Adenosine deaminase-like protein n=1 Tax=Gracilariopsis chorda TaxID=448386 RepID=A0A2V3ISX9_9FLOR|nr:Adenosine deaminase-like protein [Gracilariopsis chorda]|eukprot:PXF44837.1 Adenosine deaminase-like protein [Gracilariopsis chorda]
MLREGLDIPQWVKVIPKVELHAHLSGSVRLRTIRKLLQKPENVSILQDAESLLEGGIKSLEQGFRLFPIIHQLIPDSETLRMVVQDVLNDFAEENTAYIELRTTPRDSRNMSAEEYLKTVLQGVSEYMSAHPTGMVCRVLVSICRHQSTEVARDIAHIVERIRTLRPDLGGLIVGFDFSGNPNRGQWEDFEPILRKVRTELGLPITVHFAEVLNDKECMQILNFKPERIGHAVIMSDLVLERLMKQEPPIGVEVCLTSNMLTNSVSHLTEHPVLNHLLPGNHPICICTDDAGIFDTSLSEEYGQLLRYFPMSRDDTARLAMGALDLAFCEDENVMATVRKRMMKAMKPP